MTNPHTQSALNRAHRDLDSVLALTRDLVRIPTRGGIDPYDDAITHLNVWMTAKGLEPRVLRDETGAAVALTARVHGDHPGSTWVLDACLDTAPFGDATAWHHPPTSGVIDNGWLWGRGAADSKVAVAVFCHLAAHLRTETANLRGDLVLLFDLDEHTGGFGGAKRFFDAPDTPTDIGGVMIGYPGMDKLVIGGRGVYRVRLRVHGVASHSGGSRSTPNAISKATAIIQALDREPLPGPAAGFGPGKLTVTAIEAGEGFSVVPDLCTVNVDVRTTKAFTDHEAADLVAGVVAKVDADWPDTAPTLVEAHTRWPAYALAEGAPLRDALVSAAAAYGVDVKAKVAGPSNIGNYLAGLGIPATAGFGPAYEGLHATDERVRIDTIPVAQAVYDQAVRTLMSSDESGEA
ncbi:M20 family metallopeptidase [Nocardiopsis sp. FIRDI 009]|uniref:M20 family metallopeptidase n=1 Tax=Nocardiopsis sp. FIRDI 009 TaxID=714197 RepID=UPI001E3696B9|nr:M20/M25/M40 family metallo-hydrolase [Nocardiopsis sp. FIRDI 009]